MYYLLMHKIIRTNRKKSMKFSSNKTVLSQDISTSLFNIYDVQQFKKCETFIFTSLKMKQSANGYRELSIWYCINMSECVCVCIQRLQMAYLLCPNISPMSNPIIGFRLYSWNVNCLNFQLLSGNFDFSDIDRFWNFSHGFDHSWKQLSWHIKNARTIQNTNIAAEFKSNVHDIAPINFINQTASTMEIITTTTPIVNCEFINSNFSFIYNSVCVNALWRVYV